MKNKKIKASIWQHASVVMLMVYLTSTLLANISLIISLVSEYSEDSFLCTLGEFIISVCYVFRICLTDCIFLMPASDPQLDNSRLITVIVTLVVVILLMYLATLIYKPFAKPVIILFVVLVFVDFIASIIFMVYPMWLALSLRAVLIILLLLSLGSLKTTKTN